MQEWLTPEEIATTHKVKATTVTGWCRAGKLKGIKVGNQWRIKREDWEAFLADGQPTSKKHEGLAAYATRPTTAGFTLTEGTETVRAAHHQV